MTEPKESQIAEEHRRILVDEYCRNVGNIKIKCDDCKFVEDCVDYGWEGCKKYTQKQPHTNEEWLKSLNTYELARFIADQCVDAIRLWRDMQYWTANEKCKSNKWYVWLKEGHK